MRLTKTISLVFATAILAASAAPVHAYVLLSPRRKWKTTPVTVKVNSTGNSTITDSTKGVNATVGAIKAWGKISASTTTAQAVRGDGLPIISLHTNGHICTGSCLAATLTGYYHSEGSATYIDDADIYTNTRNPLVSTSEPDGCSGEYYIEGIMTHETGHLLGLAHSNVSGATMYPSVSACNNGPASLSSDDTAGINDLYK